MVESENPKAIGWLSSIVAIILALLLLHAFPLMGNWVDKQRTGEGKYQFDEEMCFDISAETEFDNTLKLASSTKKGGMLYRYYDGVTGTTENNKVTMFSLPLNGTIGKYGVATTNPSPGDTPVANPSETNTLGFRFNFTKKKILELDIVRIDIYLNIQGVTFSNIEFTLRDEGNTVQVFQAKKISLGNITSITVKVQDLLKINTMPDDKEIEVGFETQLNELIPGNTFVIFDMQWYCVREIKAPTLTRLAGWMSLMNIGILILVFISFPQVQVLGRFNDIGERLKKI